MGTDSTNNGVFLVSSGGNVSSLLMNGTNNLFVGGSFTSVDGSSISANSLASWDGNSWSNFENPLNNAISGENVYALSMNGTNDLFVGGEFSFESICSSNLAQISSNPSIYTETTSWISLNGGVNFTVNAVAMNGTSNLFVGGGFTSVDGTLIPANNIASWNGNSWSILGSNSINNGVASSSTVFALAMNGTNNLFVGGDFTSVDGGSILANYIASWNGNSWNILGTNSTNNGVGGQVSALAMNGTNQLFVGGSFSSVDGSSLSANNIVSWNGNSWDLTVFGINGPVAIIKALAMNGTNQLFVGGLFTYIINGTDTISANYIASWNGNSWNFLGTNSTNNGASNQIRALTMNGTSNLFVGGSFTSVDGYSISANYIASWNGNSWNILGTDSTNNGVNGLVNALAMNGTNNLFVGGSFTQTGDGVICSSSIASFSGGNKQFEQTG